MHVLTGGLQRPCACRHCMRCYLEGGGDAATATGPAARRRGLEAAGVAAAYPAYGYGVLQVWLLHRRSRTAAWLERCNDNKYVCAGIGCGPAIASYVHGTADAAAYQLMVDGRIMGASARTEEALQLAVCAGSCEWWTQVVRLALRIELAV